MFRVPPEAASVPADGISDAGVSDDDAQAVARPASSAMDLERLFIMDRVWRWRGSADRASKVELLEEGTAASPCFLVLMHALTAGPREGEVGPSKVRRSAAEKDAKRLANCQ